MFSALFWLALLQVDARPAKRWPSDYSVGADFFQTNGFCGNQLVANYILPDGSLAAGSAPWTGGNGSAGINDPSPFENHPDPFYGSGSVVVSQNQVFVVNAGSDSFSVFDIDPMDPAQPTWSANYPSNGEFPVSLAVSPDGSVACVLNSGAMNGFSCYTAGSPGWTHDASWDRSFGLNLTTPPHGPVGNTLSQILFSKDGSTLFVLVKGQIPPDLNNPTNMTFPGYIAAFSIDNGTLAQDPEKIASTIPFSIAEDITSPGTFFVTDVSTGFSAFTMGQTGVTEGTVPNQKAICWGAQSPLTNNHYIVDIVGESPITEISLDPQTLNGTIIDQRNLGNNSAGTDNAIYSFGSYDMMYVNAPGYKSVHAFQITGPGAFSLVQRYDVGDMSSDVIPSPGFVGQAIYYKPM